MLIQSPESLMTDNKLIRHILELKLILLKHLETAIHEFFVLKTLFQFDPHVGENICQVRACQLISLINSLPAKKYSKEYINKRISCIKKLKGSISKILLTLNKEIIIKRYQPYSIRIEYVNKTLKEFLETNNCTCRLYEYELLLLNLYILSHYKEINNNGDVRIDYARLQNHFNCSKTTARKLIHKYQLRLADCSCKFVKQIVKLSPKLSYLSNILDKLERTDDNGRRILPLFLTTEIIIYNLLTTNVTVIVVIERKHKIKFIDNVVMCFKANPNRSDFIYCGSDVNEIINKYNEPCFFVY
ncbi:MAG: hypothetical protein K0R49_1435, partial [Burkholderiales bacterium]|nr:hypothetical protein [Burkholderiales bacterium]